ncbi:hypothetical protein HU200_020681 [Digitaria exilis]|uniref:Uncharacterized protein n=1 Tax=Digitaria exilis TaxID=1010633 RepID=A0A835F120_9POAL|nr:hypothetical protein HU200_020681 [Digitaria exilis]
MELAEDHGEAEQGGDHGYDVVLCSTNQPCFLTHKDEPHLPLVEGENALFKSPSMCNGNLCSGAA